MNAPCDGQYVFYQNINSLSNFLIKQSKFSIKNILSGYQDKEKYYNGSAVYIYLGLTDIHRWYSPINGTIKYIETVPSVSFDELKKNKWSGTFFEERFFERNARGIIIIENADIGVEIAFIPIGMVTINTINIGVKVNDVVLKGDDLGMFEMGGSAAIMLISDNNKKKIDYLCENKDQQKLYKTPYELGMAGDFEDTKLHRMIGESIAKINTEE